MRIAVMFDNFGPYHVARLEAAARVMDVLAVEVRPKSKVYAWQSPELPPGLQTVGLETELSDVRSWHQITAALESRVRPFAPDVIALPGWAMFASLATLDWATNAGIPVVVMSESNQYDLTRVMAAERLKATIIKAYSAGLAGGNAARAYLVALGMPEAAVFLGYDAIDNGYFSSRAAAVRAGHEMPRIGPGVTLDPRWKGRYFLASARFIPVKNLHGLFQSYAAYRARAENTGDHEPWRLVLLGDGPLRAELEAQRAALNLIGVVHMPGFAQYSELPSYYGTAGAFVHASTMEPWGLVVNEAMASGLPVAVSRWCGCAEMLVADGENGILFDPRDDAAITQSMWALATHAELAKLARASQERIADWGPDRFAQGLRGACEYAASAGPRQIGLATRLAVRGLASLQVLRG